MVRSAIEVSNAWARRLRMVSSPWMRSAIEVSMLRIWSFSTVCSTLVRSARVLPMEAVRSVSAPSSADRFFVALSMMELRRVCSPPRRSSSTGISRPTRSLMPMTDVTRLLPLAEMAAAARSDVSWMARVTSRLDWRRVSAACAPCLTSCSVMRAPRSASFSSMAAPAAVTAAVILWPRFARVSAMLELAAVRAWDAFSLAAPRFRA